MGVPVKFHRSRILFSRKRRYGSLTYCGVMRTWLTPVGMVLSDTLTRLFALRGDDLKVVFTLSPYRYRKYGMVENARVKARLLLLIDALCRRFEGAAYFPAYEIVTDELRDYRFYKEDMLHPSDQAVGYVWERFREWTFTPEMDEFAREWQSIARASAHRPLHPESEEHKRFVQTMESRRQLFRQKWQTPAPND